MGKVRMARVVGCLLLLGLAHCGSGSGSAGSRGTAAASSSLAAGWKSRDIGSVGQAGSTDYSAGVTTIAGSGADIWNSADGFRFVHQTLSGDGEITARVTSLDPTDEWAKSGVMIRETLDPGSPFAMTVVTPLHGTSMQVRLQAGQGCGLDFGPNLAPPAWVRLTRAGDQFTGAASSDGRTWTTIAVRTIAMAAEVYVGLCVTAHNNALRAASTIDSIGLSGSIGGWIAATGAAGLTPVHLGNVALNDGFWKPRIETNRTVSIPMIRQALVDNHTLDNFPKAAGLMGGDHDGFMWADGDTYALLEAMAIALELHPDPALESQMEGIIAHVIAAQVKSGPLAGYCNTYFQLGNAGRGYGGSTVTTQPWEDLIAAHEHVVAGGFLQAAIAHFRATGRTYFLDAARKYSDHMSSVFGEGRRSGVPGHQGPEYVLFNLWSVPGVGRPSDFEQSRFYLEERGRHSGGRAIYGEFCQDLWPIRSSTEPLGHGVRGPYMWAGATDLAGASGDTGLLEAVDGIWTNVVERKMYPTGGFGHRLYNEGFSVDHDLSSEQAYNETCAACGMIFWTHRLANLRADARYTDVMERVLYNGFASGRSLDGTRLYYNNDMIRTGAKSRTGILCCPMNIIRTTPSVPGYQYATAPGDGIWTHLYIAGQASIPYGSGAVSLTQETAYPWDGAVKITVGVTAPTTFALHLRIPGWAAGATATVNGAPIDMGGASRGYLPVSRTWQSGDVVQLALPMTLRRLHSDPKVFAHQGRAAIARGPIVYCLEADDNPVDVHRIVIPAGAALSASFDGGLLGGVTKIMGTGHHADNGSPVAFTMIPYAVWDNRSHDGGMCVMVPETTGAASVHLDRGRLGNATVTASFGADVAAVNDGILPKDSNDQTIPRFTWWNHQGTEEWIAVQFPQPIRVWRSDLFWFNDSGAGGGCDFPATIRHEYWTGSAWQPVQLDADYANSGDLFASWHFTTVRFAPVTTTKLRLVVQLKPGKSAGVLEWRVPE